MAVRYSCDGCGCMIDEDAEPKKLGTVLVREYCEQCAPKAEEYLKAVSDAHTEIAKQWSKLLKAKRKEYLNDLLALPDTDAKKG